MQKGFTMIETLIYLAIFSMVITGVVASAYILLESSGKVQTKAMILQEEQFMLGTVERLVGDAASVSAPTAGSSGTTLSILTFGGAAYSFTLSGTDLLLNGIALNNTSVRVTDISFQRSAVSPDGITAEFTVSANAPNGQVVTFSASTTKYLRK